jgi:hypothetical protein
MTVAVERIKREIRSLAPEEVEALLRDLQNEYVMPSPGDEDEASVEEAWDAEIDRRVKEIEEGKVQLISGEEADRQTDALFASLGIKRPVHRP